MSFFKDVIDIVVKYYPFLLKGIGYTMLISLVGTVAGLLIGLLTGVIRTAPYSKNVVLRVLHKIVNGIIAVYIEIFRGTPMMVQSMVIYWGYAFATGGNTLPLIPSGILIVSINTGAYMAETVRGGILSIDPGQTEGAKAIGMTHVQTMNAVILPQALRNIMPQIGNNLIINIKDTCVLSVIGTVELFFATKSVAGAMYTYFEAFTITMAIYFVLTFSCSRLLRLCESKMDGPDSYELYDLATTDTLAHTTGLYSYPKKPRENTQNNDIRDGGR